jgi:hypothetical protein
VYALWTTYNLSTAQRGAALYWDDRSSISRNNRLVQASNNVVNPISIDNISANDVCAANTWHYVTTLHDPGNATAALRSTIHVDGGSAIQNNVNTASTGSTAPSGVFRLGATLTAGFYLTGSIAEVIGTTDLGDRAAIEAYVVDKYPSLA